MDLKNIEILPFSPLYEAHDRKYRDSPHLLYPLLFCNVQGEMVIPLQSSGARHPKPKIHHYHRDTQIAKYLNPRYRNGHNFHRKCSRLICMFYLAYTAFSITFVIHGRPPMVAVTAATRVLLETTYVLIDKPSDP